MKTEPTLTEIKQVLAHPFEHKWSIQGFGMLRTYLGDDQITRLHIWDMGSAFADVSRIHDHPWDFTSRIVTGHMANQRYIVDGPSGEEFQSARIRCGETAQLLEDPVKALVEPKMIEFYNQEEVYSQEAPEFHESFPSPGTVTVIQRSFKENREVARVLWRDGPWGDAKPRPATREEIEHFIGLANESL